MSPSSALKYATFRVGSDETTVITVTEAPVRLTFPDGGTLDLAIGQTFEVLALSPAAEAPKTTGWEWVRDSWARGDRAKARRKEEPTEVIDGDGDRWIRQEDGTYAVVWGIDDEYWSGWSLQRIEDKHGLSK